MNRYALPLSIALLAAAIVWHGVPKVTAQQPSQQVVCEAFNGFTADKMAEKAWVWMDAQVGAGRTNIINMGTIAPNMYCAW